jgi:cation transporter-like permease
MVGAGLFVFGLVVGIGAILWRVFAGEGFRPLLNLVETCMILGSVFFATGLIGELIAAQRAEMRELRARLEEMAQERDTRQNP